MQGASEFIAATASLVGALAWPVLIGLLVLRFRGPLTSFLMDLGQISFKAGGIEASFARKQVEAAVAVGAAVGSRSSPGAEASEADLRSAAEAVLSSVPDARTQNRLSGSRILWVDDRPENNEYERQALEALGMSITSSTSTQDALDRTRTTAFDLVISDMGRPGDERAGYTLLSALHKDRNDTPFVIYAGSNLPEHRAEAVSRGAVGSTNSPEELLRLVVKGLRERRSRT